MATINRLPGNFGAEILGLDVSSGADDDTMRLLTETLYEHQVIAVRGQQLDRDQYLRFGRQWGEPIPHVLDHMRMPGYPDLLTVGNTEQRDEDPKIRNGAALWHTDQSYESEPASATMLYSIIAPESGGETQFCNMTGAYDGLDEATKAEIAGIAVAHKYGRGKRNPDEPPANPIINDDQDQRVPDVHHPLARPHPMTARKALYALGHGAYGIRGKSETEANEILDRFKAHVLQERYIYRHKYGVGDIVVWDTMQTMHRATPIGVATGDSDSRLLWRISVRGKPHIYRAQAA